MKTWCCPSFKMLKLIISASSRQLALSSSTCSGISCPTSMYQFSWIRLLIFLRVRVKLTNLMQQLALRNYCSEKLLRLMHKVNLVFPYLPQQTFNLKFFKSFFKDSVSSWMLAKTSMPCVHSTEQSSWLRVKYFSLLTFSDKFWPLLSMQLHLMKPQLVQTIFISSLRQQHSRWDIWKAPLLLTLWRTYLYHPLELSLSATSRIWWVMLSRFSLFL